MYWIRHAYSFLVFEDILRTLLDNSDKCTRDRSFLVHLEHSTHMEDKPRKEDIRVRHLLSTWEDIIPDDYKFNFFDGDSWQELDLHDQKTGATFGALQVKLQQVLENMLDEWTEIEAKGEFMFISSFYCRSCVSLQELSKAFIFRYIDHLDFY